ncbi:acyl-CoA thioesterase [Bermanella marisrubri]|uniref:Predicted thioesterase n=1 Tax=Bermanella marisrubri TaxID=207949 RepID=Q1MZL2_9GAMM|nr:acyl-CoA thioesterase [Bermanella marisrubri]EAT11399.1 predicted thioesterase [Oceanobacter sp. RED65] [Bermanella marisrubri]QIZ85602.1 acyl-CoA thioesterase [Bermanella marisrubri]
MSDMQWDYEQPFTMEVCIAEKDTDRLGHTNNQVYLNWMEEISWQHIEAVGITWEKQEADGKAMAIRHTELDYENASYAGEQIIVATWITSCERRMTTSRAFQIVRVQDQKTLVRGRCDYVCIDLKRGKPARMPDWYEATLKSMIPESLSAASQE